MPRNETFGSITFILLFTCWSFGQSVRESPVPSDVPRPRILCLNYGTIHRAHISKAPGVVVAGLLRENVVIRAHS